MTSTISTTTPTQVAYPWQAAARTAVQAFLSFAALYAVALPVVQPFLQQYLPASWVAAVVAAGVFVAGLAAVVSRIMALPQLQAFLTSIHLGTKPKSTIDAGTVTPAAPAVITSLPVTDPIPVIAQPVEIDPTPTTADPQHVAQPDV